MKPKPITSSGYVVAAFDGPRPRFLCRDSKHGHWVVTLELQKATCFGSEAEAVAAAADYRRLDHGRLHVAPGTWRAYAVSTKTTFAEVEAEQPADA